MALASSWTNPVKALALSMLCKNPTSTFWSESGSSSVITPSSFLREGQVIGYISVRVQTCGAPLSSLSLHDHPCRQERRERRIMIAPSALSPSHLPHCPMFAGVRNRRRMRVCYSSQTGCAHVVILYQGGHGAYDRLQWREHIGGFLGDFYSHPGRTVCRLPVRVLIPNSSTIARCFTDIVECGAKGESNSA